MNKKIALGQFYTPLTLSKEMVKLALELLDSDPSEAIELAAGEGNLIAELRKQVPFCKISAVDLDLENTKLLKKHDTEFKVYNADALMPLNFLGEEKFILGLGNPPFLSNILVDKFIQEILSKYLNLDFKVGSTVRAEYVFICQYLSIIKNNGLLAIILPESIISGSRSKKFREGLLENWRIEKILEIQGNPFEQTEAKTHILFIRKAIPNKSNISIQRLNFLNKVEVLGDINIELLEERMDFSFFINSMNYSKQRKLSDFAEISRGKRSHKELKELNQPYLHTTNLDSNPNEAVQKIENNITYTTRGDVVMCRVGTRIVGKSIEYMGERIEISDCLYNIKFKENVIKKEFMDYINSPSGLASLKAIAKGVCSRYITKKDLENFLF
ncbi:N-6 DNA methylase [Acinetobacter sp. AS23]|uniref:N-6 DNA methylase n=1 Tax=Acinetobacter sp. AS23 TaxID=2871688 RepID=UPI002026AF76|nr:N-6 DNA methylase [Acinetobacter sp. AS23]URM41976.1 SAM-dependent methyltransferase [Acinetobacter sp. AS23]